MYFVSLSIVSNDNSQTDNVKLVNACARFQFRFFCALCQAYSKLNRYGCCLVINIHIGHYVIYFAYMRMNNDIKLAQNLLKQNGNPNIYNIAKCFRYKNKMNKPNAKHAVYKLIQT